MEKKLLDKTKLVLKNRMFLLLAQFYNDIDEDKSYKNGKFTAFYSFITILMKIEDKSYKNRNFTACNSLIITILIETKAIKTAILLHLTF